MQLTVHLAGRTGRVAEQPLLDGRFVEHVSAAGDGDHVRRLRLEGEFRQRTGGVGHHGVLDHGLYDGGRERGHRRGRGYGNGRGIFLLGGCFRDIVNIDVDGV